MDDDNEETSAIKDDSEQRPSKMIARRRERRSYTHSIVISLNGGARACPPKLTTRGE